jgi:hypothetical protein
MPHRPDDDDEYEYAPPRQPNPTDEAVSTLIPYRNGLALAAYYCGVFSLIPIAGLALGPLALGFGIAGYRFARKYPKAKGTGHSIAGIILGTLTSLGNWGVAILVLIGVMSGTFKR